MAPFVPVALSSRKQRYLLTLLPLVDALEPIADEVLDTDLWSILSWMIEGVGPPWTLKDLEETGRLYRIPAVRPRSA